MIDIEEFYGMYKDKLSETTKKKLDILLDEIGNSKFRDDKKNQIKFIIYNNKHKINNTICN